MKRTTALHAERLVAEAASKGLDAVLVGDLVRPGDSGREAMADLSWLTGFRGTSGLALVGPGMRLFFTDFRYTELAGARVPEGFEIVEAEGKLIDAVAGRVRGKVAVDDAATSVRAHAELREAAGDGVELVFGESLVAPLRRIKDDAEIDAIARAAKLTDEVYAWIEEQGLAGRTEREVALGAETRMRELGAEGPSFPTIVAAGANGAHPHAVPGDHEIAAGELVVIDMGAIVDGYCSDCTRTLADGEPDPSQREIYELVLKAQTTALDAVRPGASGKALDAIARRIIEEGGHGDHFGHGLGHGVGVAVHESPTLSKRSEDDLEPGDVVTVEPGIYIPGEFGVRIEDLVVVTEDGHRVLTSRPK